MNDMSNTPVMPESPGPKPFFQVWIDALTKPNESTFAAMVASPSAKATTAYLWVFIGYLVEFFFSSLVQSAAMSSLLSRYGGGSSGAASGFVGRIVTAVCGAPIIALIATLLFAVFVAIVQWIAKMFGGRGTYDQMIYAFASILAPFMIISGVVSLLAAIPFVGLCFSAILALAGLYAFVLEIMAVKGVNQFGWGAAIGSLLIPGLVIGFICGCLIGVSVAVFGMAFKDVLQQIQQGIGNSPSY
jgi:hypothetical protein